MAPTPRAHSPRAQRCLCRRDRWALEVGFSLVFCPRQQFSGLREGRPNPCERREVRTLTGTHLSPATWPLGCRVSWPAVTWAGLADREGLRAGASKVTGDRATCDPRTLTSA